MRARTSDQYTWCITQEVTISIYFRSFHEKSLLTFLYTIHVHIEKWKDNKKLFEKFFETTGYFVIIFLYIFCVGKTRGLLFQI